MDLTRRDLVRASGVAVAAGLSGCAIGGSPRPSTSVAVEIRDSFDSTSPVSVPVAVEVTVRDVDDRDGALQGVDLVAVGTDREPMAVTGLGSFTYADAEASQRRTDTVDEGVLDSTTIYEARWSLDLTIDAPTVPAWLTFRIDDMVVDREEPDPGSSGMLVGTAAARPPPPHVRLTASRLQIDPPLASTIGAPDYDRHRWSVMADDVPGSVLFPPPDGLSRSRSDRIYHD